MCSFVAFCFYIRTSTHKVHVVLNLVQNFCNGRGVICMLRVFITTCMYMYIMDFAEGRAYTAAAVLVGD